MHFRNRAGIISYSSFGHAERVVEMQRNAERVAEEVERQVKVEREMYICERKQLIEDQVIELEEVKAAFERRDDHILCLTERIKKLEALEAREQEEPIKRKRPKEGIESSGGSQPPLRRCSSLRGLEQWVGLLTPPPLAAVHEILQNVTLTLWPLLNTCQNMDWHWCAHS